MKTQIIDFNQPHPQLKACVLTLGGFDGIHPGHQTLIKELVLEAKKAKAPSCLCVFNPLPFQFLRALPLKRLFTLYETERLLKPLGIDFFCIIPFDLKFSKLSPEDFVSRFIVRQFAPVKIITGYDFFFAHKKEGNFEVLKSLSQPFGFQVKRVEAHLYKGKPVSSSRIRDCLIAGKMEELKKLLGRSFSIYAPVVRGEGRGRELGFPTANLKVDKKELPLRGVYAGRAKVHAKANHVFEEGVNFKPDEAKSLADFKQNKAKNPSHPWYQSVINIGRRPTFASSHPELLVEVHIMSQNLDLYHQDLEVQLDCFIREEKSFKEMSHLKQAIKQDIKTALAWYKANSP